MDGNTISKEDTALANTLSINVSIWHLASIFSVLIAVVVVRSHIGTQLAILTPLCYHLANGVRILLANESVNALNPSSANFLGLIHISLAILCFIIYNRN